MSFCLSVPVCLSVSVSPSVWVCLCVSVSVPVYVSVSVSVHVYLLCLCVSIRREETQEDVQFLFEVSEGVRRVMDYSDNEISSMKFKE